MRFSASQKHHLYAEIAKLLRAGFSIDTAAATILKQRPAAASRRYLEGLRSGLAERQTIADAVRGTEVDLVPLEISIVEAGEKGGRLEESYDHLAGYFAMLDRARNRIRASLIYPLILLHAGIIIPAIPKAILAGDSGSGVRSILASLALLYVSTAVAVYLVIGLSRLARSNASVDRMLGAIPLAGKARRSLALGRFCKVFHIHLLAAFPISTGLRAAGAASQSGEMLLSTERVASEIEAGNSLGGAIRGERAFPPEFEASLNTAEVSGTLDTDLDRWARAYHESAVQALDAASGWFPKLVYVIVMLFVAWQILSIGLGYLGAIERAMEM